MRRLLLITLAIFATTVAHASAETVIVGAKTEPFQTWVNESLIPTPDGQINIDFGSPDVVWTQPPNTIHWWNANVPLSETEHATFMHELGHVWESTRLRFRRNAHLRWRFARLVRPSYARAYKDSKRVPRLDWDAYFDEQFAQGYAFCAIGVFDPPTTTFWGFGYDPTPAQQARVCALITRSSIV